MVMLDVSHFQTCQMPNNSKVLLQRQLLLHHSKASHPPPQSKQAYHAALYARMSSQLQELKKPQQISSAPLHLIATSIGNDHQTTLTPLCELRSSQYSPVNALRILPNIQIVQPSEFMRHEVYSMQQTKMGEGLFPVLERGKAISRSMNIPLVNGLIPAALNKAQ